VNFEYDNIFFYYLDEERVLSSVEVVKDVTLILTQKGGHELSNK